jgi:archaellum component FlaG (FlaF/FlaG flagellin family)
MKSVTQGKRPKMDKRILIIGLAAALVVSVFLNVALYYQNQSVNQQKADFTAYYSKFGNVPLQSISYNFSPPVSMYRALTIALENDGWDTTSLENMTVNVSLDYRKFYSYNTTLGSHNGSELLYSVTQPVNDYSPVTVNNTTNSTTYRYIWAIVVTENLGVIQIPPPGLYWIDAATAEIIPQGFLI